MLIIHSDMSGWKSNRKSAREYSRNNSEITYHIPPYHGFCFTGMRYSDAANLKWENVNEELIEFVTIKNNKRLRVDLNDHSKEILENTDP